MVQTFTSRQPSKKELFSAAWWTVYDPELNDLDFRLLTLLIERDNKLSYFKGSEYIIEEEWLSKTLNKPLTEIMGSISNLQKAGYISLMAEHNHWAINWDRIQHQGEVKNNWYKQSLNQEETKEDKGESLDSLISKLEARGGNYSLAAAGLRKQIKDIQEAENREDEELDRLLGKNRGL